MRGGIVTAYCCCIRLFLVGETLHKVFADGTVRGSVLDVRKHTVPAMNRKESPVRESVMPDKVQTAAASVF